MAIPDYQTIMLPLLQYAADEKEHRFREAVNKLANKKKRGQVYTLDNYLVLR